ncbi:DUF4352 domain-containing protein [Enterococcus sp. AZ126]|uniref:DUF4352 domain-containing protein n=1 Tax=Enterococcus sp. AZ126 TaxID=2774635 RepID=UPI003F280594
MKKKVFILVSVVLLLAGCTKVAKTKNSENSEVSEVKQEFKTKLIQNTKMKLLSIDAMQSGVDEKKKIIQLHFAIKNQESTVIGIGGSDFKLKAEKKQYSVVSDANNIGQEIEVGKEIKGDIYFEVPENLKKAELVYIPNEKILGKWDLIIPQAK